MAITYLHDIKSLIRALGGQSVVLDAHSRIAKDAGYKQLKIATINGWVCNNRILISRLPELYHVADELGVKLDFRDHIRVLNR